MIIDSILLFFFFFFNDTATTEIYTLSLHDALPNSAAMAGPWLVGIGIDRGIPAVRSGDWAPLAAVFGALLGCAAVDGVLRTAFLIRTGRIGQDVLLDLRRRVFDHFQRLSLAFHERYTSGRVVSRLTSDLDSLDELLDAGLDRKSTRL